MLMKYMYLIALSITRPFIGTALIVLLRIHTSGTDLSKLLFFTHNLVMVCYSVGNIYDQWGHYTGHWLLAL